MSKPGYLLDVNVLVALMDEGHVHHDKVLAWFQASAEDWGTCAFTEAGLVRIMSNPRASVYTIEEVSEALKALISHPGYRFWPIQAGWAAVTMPLRGRMFGHQQVTDAWLLGLAVKENGILVTLDKAIRHLAGERYKSNVLVLE